MRWSIVEVPYEGEDKTFRAVKMNDSGMIIEEKTFKTRVEAEVHIAYKQKEEQNESI